MEKTKLIDLGMFVDFSRLNQNKSLQTKREIRDAGLKKILKAF